MPCPVEEVETAQFLVTVGGVTNDRCGNCTAVNAAFTVEYSAGAGTNACTYLLDLPTDPSCADYPLFVVHNLRVMLSFACEIDFDPYTLELKRVLHVVAEISWYSATAGSPATSFYSALIRSRSRIDWPVDCDLDLDLDVEQAESTRGFFPCPPPDYYCPQYLCGLDPATVNVNVARVP